MGFKQYSPGTPVLVSVLHWHLEKRRGNGLRDQRACAAGQGGARHGTARSPDADSCTSSLAPNIVEIVLHFEATVPTSPPAVERSTRSTTDPCECVRLDPTFSKRRHAVFWPRSQGSQTLRSKTTRNATRAMLDASAKGRSRTTPRFPHGFEPAKCRSRLSASALALSWSCPMLSRHQSCCHWILACALSFLSTRSIDTAPEVGWQRLCALESWMTAVLDR